MKILVLSDHRTHGKGESIYPLLCEMNNQVACQDLRIATRGDKRNHNFFQTFSEKFVYAKKD
jgi:glutathione synthase